MSRTSYTRTPEIKEKMRQALLAYYYRTGKSNPENTLRRDTKKANRVKQNSPEFRAKASFNAKKRYEKGEGLAILNANNTGKNNPFFGKHHTETTKEVIRQKHYATKKFQGSNNFNWQGGISTEHTKIRNSHAYKTWRKHVFQRDLFTCQACKQVGGKLQADHELPFAFYPELRFEILNGRTLCVECHKKTPTYLSGARNFATV